MLCFFVPQNSLPNLIIHSTAQYMQNNIAKHFQKQCINNLSDNARIQTNSVDKYIFSIFKQRIC